MIMDELFYLTIFVLSVGLPLVVMDALYPGKSIRPKRRKDRGQP